MNQHDVTQLLVEAGEGARGAVDRLLPLVYDELHALARKMMARERPDHTLQATALVHEAYIKLVDQTRVQWQNRAHFYALSAQAIRRILVDHARGHQRAKRGGGRVKMALDSEPADKQRNVVDVMALDEALKNLARSDEEASRIVEMRFFAGLTTAETAEVLGVSTRSVERKWRYARARLYQVLSGAGEPLPGGKADGR